MFFLLAIRDFILILGLFYTFLIFWIAFIGIQFLEDVVVPKRTKFFGVPLGLLLRPLSLDLPCQLDIFGHDGYPLCVHSAKVGILEEAYQVCLRGLLQRHYHPTLESDVYFAEVLSKLSHQSLEWQLPDEQFSGLLVPPNLSQGHCAWSIPARLLRRLLGWWQLLHAPFCFALLFLDLWLELLMWSLATARQLWMPLVPVIIIVFRQWGRVVYMLLSLLIIHLQGMTNCILPNSFPVPM